MNFYINHNLTDLATPIDADRLEQLLRETDYDESKTNFLVRGFRQGFDLGYRGPVCRQDLSNNIPFTVGDKFDMWGKVMKEVSLGRYAGPYTVNNFPFKHFVQSPIGLVPKDRGNQTRLIFHLSYKFPNGNESINFWTPEEKCSVRYNDLDHAIRNSLRILETCDGPIFYSKTDLKSAFRAVPISTNQYFLLCLKAKHPVTDKLFYFFDKCLPFGASISCALFTELSEGLRHVVETKAQRFYHVTNYLDDFLFIEVSQPACDALMNKFLDICGQIKFPVALDKTVWGTKLIIFLGILLNGSAMCLAIPEDKRIKTLHMVQKLMEAKKSTVRGLQQLAGTLNFLCKAIHPGRVFVRRMYAKFSFEHDLRDKYSKPINEKLKPYHHVRLDAEFRQDCRIWQQFLLYQESVNRPFIDFQADPSDSIELDFYTDASLNENFGVGCFFPPNWGFAAWEPGWIAKVKPSIMYLELVALCAGVFMWQERLANMKVEIFCDNTGVRDIVNKNTSGCKNSMLLLRLLTLNSLKYNRRIKVKYVESAKNVFADHLSRMKLDQFFDEVRKQGKKITQEPSQMPETIWPVSKIWIT